MAGNSNPDGKGLVHFCQVAKIDGNVFTHAFFNSASTRIHRKIIIFHGKNEVTSYLQNTYSTLVKMHNLKYISSNSIRISKYFELFK